MKQANLYISSFKVSLRILIFILCISPVFYYAGEAYKGASEKNVINYFTKSRYDDFYKLPVNSLDMVFVGSSHSYCTFDPENFDNALKIQSFQMGTPLQHPDTTYFLLKEILRYQKPKTAVIEVYWDMLDDDFEMKQANSFFEVLKDDSLKNEYIKEVFPIGEKVKYNLLPMKYQQDYFAYEADVFDKGIQKKYGVSKEKDTDTNGIEEYRSKGYVYCDTVLPKKEYDETNQFKNLDGKKWSASKKQKDYLEKSIELCRENNIEVILVTAPIANVSMEYIKNYEKINEWFENFSKERGVKYIDYNIINKKENLLSNENFRDDAHLNDSGVKIINKHFLKWLIDNSDFINKL